MDAHKSSSFRNLLKHYRVAAGLTQKQLAERSGLSLGDISDLERGLRTSPREDTVRLLADALNLLAEDRTALLEAAQPIARSTSANGNAAVSSIRLPTPPTRLLGRDDDVASVVALLRDRQTRLVTLTGTGGVGKTRLALEAARSVAPTFPDGSAFVDLSAVGHSDLVLPTIAGALGIHETVGLPLEDALHRAIGSQRRLILVDNFEHVLGASTSIATLLAQCPELVVLATSRVPLGVRGEHQFPVHPLELPWWSAHGSVTSLGANAAVGLFVERARQADPRFALTERNAPTIVGIVRGLDGLPLALELAAARVKALGPYAIHERLDHRLSLLTSGAADMPARHQSLRATIMWSHDLLTLADEALFRRLGVFVGGFTLEAATKVTVIGSEEDVLEGIASLLDKHLITARDGSPAERRYGMLETIREFALEQLERHGDSAITGRRHAAYCLTVARAGAMDLADAASGVGLARMETELPNMRAALAWFRDNGPAEDGLRLATALGAFWRLRSASCEGRGWLETFLTQDALDRVSARERVATLQWAGELAALDGDMPTAETRLQESLAIARQINDRRGIAATLAAIGSMYVQSGRLADSVPIFTEGAAIAGEIGEHRQAAFLTAYLALALGHQGDLDRAAVLAAESRATLRRLGDVRSFEAAFAAMAGGWLAIPASDLPLAEQRLNDAAALSRDLDSRAILATTIAGLGEVAMERNDLATAAAWYREGLEMAWSGGFPPGLAVNLQGLIRLALQCGEIELAGRLARDIEPVAPSVGALPISVVEKYLHAMAQLQQRIAREPGGVHGAGITRHLPDDSIADAKAIEERLRDARST